MSRRPAGLARAERELAARVIDALLREDYGGLSRRVRRTPGGAVLDLPGAVPMAVSLEPDGFLADYRVARPAPAGLTVGRATAALDAVACPQDAAGVAAFAAECRDALRALRLRRRHLAAASARLAKACGPRGAGLLGAAGQRAHDALAAAAEHPVYPTSLSRTGFTDRDTLRHAPEYFPEFALRWAAVRRSALTSAGPARPDWWPGLADVGLPGSLAATHELIPVHPVTARRALGRAVRESGLGEPGADGLPGAVLAPRAVLRVTPTLSTRTVMVTADPHAHLKLPLPVSTLGRANQRAIKPATLADAALVARILAAAAAADAQLGRLLVADEASYGHAGHPYLGYLLRRMPPGLAGCRVVPVAALLAPAAVGRGGLVIEDLARWWSGGDVLGLAEAFFAVLFAVQVRLLARYGIALEAHQQNAAIVAGPGPGGPLRLLVKDFDGALIRHDRLAGALGRAVPPAAQFTDPRMLTGSDDALVDVFITMAVHLCTGALAFGLARRGLLPLAAILARARRQLALALDREPGAPAAALLRERVLEASRLPGKGMVTAGTLVARSRTGARDINKFYSVSGPNYLREAR